MPWDTRGIHGALWAQPLKPCSVPFLPPPGTSQQATPSTAHRPPEARRVFNCDTQTRQKRSANNTPATPSLERILHLHFFIFIFISCSRTYTTKRTDTASPSTTTYYYPQLAVISPNMDMVNYISSAQQHVQNLKNTRLAALRPLGEFFDWQRISRPADMSEYMKRAGYNMWVSARRASESLAERLRDERG